MQNNVIKYSKIVKYLRQREIFVKPVLTWQSNWMSMYFPKRLELSFFSVLAFPKAWRENKATLWNDKRPTLWSSLIRIHLIYSERTYNYNHFSYFIITLYKSHYIYIFKVKSSRLDLQDRIGHEHLVPDGVQQGATGAANSVILQDLLSGLGFSRPALSRDQNEVVISLR